MGRLGGAAINAWLEEDVTIGIQAATLASENNALYVVAWIAAKLAWEYYVREYPEHIEAVQETVCQYIADKTGLPIDKVRTVGDLVMNASSFVRGGRYVAKQVGRYMARKNLPKAKEQKEHKDDHSLKALPVPTDQRTDHSSSSPISESDQNQSSLQYWNKTVEHKGNKVYQRDDLFNANPLDPVGQENIQRMKEGKAPKGVDGESINLHHMLQTQEGAIAEVTETFHTKNTKIIHINPKTIPSGIDRSEFNNWKKSYWRARVKQILGEK